MITIQHLTFHTKEDGKVEVTSKNGLDFHIDSKRLKEEIAIALRLLSKDTEGVVKIEGDNKDTCFYIMKDKNKFTTFITGVSSVKTRLKQLLKSL